MGFCLVYIDVRLLRPDCGAYWHNFIIWIRRLKDKTKLYLVQLN